jgi:formate hydrogenlyase subunit 3/multisubunit Na+/H+ antiporter MnhD subunit
MAMVGATTLVLAYVCAWLIRPDEILLIGDSGLVTTAFLRTFLLFGTFVGGLLAAVGAAAGGSAIVLPVTLGILGTSALALSLPDPRDAVIAATAGGTAGAMLCIGGIADRGAATVGMRVLRAAIVAGAMAISATAWIGRDLSELAARPVVFGLAYLAMALAVAIRFGAIPVHAWAARLTNAINETELPLVTAWAPAALAVVALAWADTSIAPLLVDLDEIRLVIVLIALASILLASVAAWIQDDLEHIVGYSIIGDAGVVMLAIAALDPAAWAPARTWILAFVVTRSAFAAWAGATRAGFGSGRLRDLRAWVLRAPLLGLTFAIVVLASIGLPGLAAWNARAAIIDAALAGPFAVVAWIGVLSPLLYYARLAAIGLDRAAADARTPIAWRPRLRPFDVTRPRAWFAMTWSDDRALIAAATALLLAVFALSVSAGGFGGPQAAAGLPPSLQGGEGVPNEEIGPPTGPDASFEPEESFDPEASFDPDASFDAEPIGSEGPEPGASLEPDTSFEPVPTE